jgi:hypothetical protein
LNLVAKEYVGAQDPLRGCMNRQRRRFFHWAAAAAALPVLSWLAEAQDLARLPHVCRQQVSCGLSGFEAANCAGQMP